MESNGIPGPKGAQRNARLGQFPTAWQRIVVVSAKKIKSLEWLWTLHSTMTFSPDGAHFVLGEVMPDGYVHLCAYETATLSQVKCLVRLYKSRGSHHGPLDWSDDQLFIQAGSFDDAFIGWVNIQGW